MCETTESWLMKKKIVKARMKSFTKLIIETCRLTRHDERACKKPKTEPQANKQNFQYLYPKLIHLAHADRSETSN